MKEDDDVIIDFDDLGKAEAIYTEDFNLKKLGACTSKRVSHVEPEGDGWIADMTPVGGPVLKGFRSRSAALRGEKRWLRKHLLKIE